MKKKIPAQVFPVNGLKFLPWGAAAALNMSEVNQ